MPITIDNCVAEYCTRYANSGKSPVDFAAYMLAKHWQWCTLVLDVIGMFPSSEPELAALQRAFR